MSLLRRPRRLHRALAIALIAAAVGRPALAQSRELRVFAAASLNGAFTELGQRYQAAHPGTRVTFNFAGSQELVAQLSQGAQADVFASADQRWMDRAGTSGLLEGSPRIFGRNRLVVLIPRGDPGGIHTLQDLASPGKKLVLADSAVPVGKYTRQALTALGKQPGFSSDFSAQVLRNVVSEEDNVKGVVAKVQLGEADAGVAYRSDVTPSVAKDVTEIELPEAANVIAEYPIALLASSRDSSGGRQFIELVLSREGQDVLASFGFQPVVP